MKNVIKITTLCLFLSAKISLFGQVPKLLDPTNAPIFNKCTEMKSEGFNWWKCDSLHCGELFTVLKPHSGLSVNDTMAIVKTWEDSVTLLKHVKYQQYYKGIPMENVYYLEHSLNCNVLITNGFLCEGMDKSNIPIFSESSALQKAIEHIGVDRKFAWQDDTLQYYLQHDSESTYTTYYPIGELLWAHIGDRVIKPSNFKLAWKFRIWAVDSPEVLKNIYVDALNGQILKDPNIALDGTFNHLYYGNKNIDTKWYGGFSRKHFLETDNDGLNIKTKDNNYDGSWKTTSLPGDNDDNWDNNRWAATACHWVAQESWFYWRDKWKRNGLDNNWRPIKVLADYPFFNAQYIPNLQGNGADGFRFGRLDIGLSAALDIGGHEFTHGVTNYSANLENWNESGALNESYSDIFGFLIERHHFGFRNWTIGEDASALIIRNIQNPKLNPPTTAFGAPLMPNYPNYYLEPGFWYTGSSDDGGVHHNCAVQNQCFYFLSMGGTQLGVTVTGIGIDKAARIVEYALVNGLVLSNTNYQQNRECWVTAAKILFGECSNEHIQTCRAWAACNIGSPCPCEPKPELICWANRFRYLQGTVNPLSKANSLSIDEGIVIFPNPAVDLLNINFNGLFNESIKSEKIISIINVYGSTIKTFKVAVGVEQCEISVGELKAGTYSIEVAINGRNFQSKFIKL